MKAYLITRLYNLNDKIMTCKLEKVLHKKGIKTYMPFRDTKEEFIDHQRWKKEIFKYDIQEVENCDFLIGFFDFVFDEGVGFEIGYALSKGKQIVLLNSDFIEYEIFGKKRKVIDPIFEYFDNFLFFYGSHNLDYNNFCNSLNIKLDEMLNKIVVENKIFNRFQKKSSDDYFIESGNSLSFSKFKNSSKRLKTWNFEDDFNKILSSENVYIIVNGNQMHIGSSIICGLCYGLGIDFYLVYDRNIYLFGKEVMKSNLMIDCAKKGEIEIEEFIRKFGN